MLKDEVLKAICAFICYEHQSVSKTMKYFWSVFQNYNGKCDYEDSRVLQHTVATRQMKALEGKESAKNYLSRGETLDSGDGTAELILVAEESRHPKPGSLQKKWRFLIITQIGLCKTLGHNHLKLWFLVHFLWSTHHPAISKSSWLKIPNQISIYTRLAQPSWWIRNPYMIGDKNMTFSKAIRDY